MLHLDNAQLRVDVLDPADAADHARLGTRFGWGGYVWQVHDRTRGPLLAGPEWPHPEPDPFNGQGLPESIRARELGTNRPLTIDGRVGFAIGIGDVAVGPRNELLLTRPGEWSVAGREAALVFGTAHDAIGLACTVMRTIRLEDRSIVSATEVANTGARAFPLHWFAHPFFPLDDGMTTCALPAGTTIAVNSGFKLDPGGTLVFQRPFRGPHDGHMAPLQLAPGAALRARIAHPKIDGVTMTTDFTPSACPVWANGHTFSIEPYLLTELAPGASRAWSVRYEFE